MFGKRSGPPTKKENEQKVVPVEPDELEQASEGSVQPLFPTDGEDSASNLAAESGAASVARIESAAESAQSQYGEAQPSQAADTEAAPEKPKRSSKLVEIEQPLEDPSRPKTLSQTEAKYQDIKTKVFNALIETVDLTELANLPPDDAREDITDWVNEIVSLQNMVLSATEQRNLIGDICNDILGLGPLEPLIARDDIADIMVNGPK